jgi:hypothetical protein|tara:strand:- start:46 stop:744 length:699 start_codon:yes stop_codon:yes gene_type:complete
MSKDNNKINQLAKEVSDLNFKIKLDTIKLKRIKEQLIDLMVNENVPRVITDKSNIKKSKWGLRFSTQLRKEFYKLDDKKKEELLSKDLLKIYYRLNSKKYEEIKNKQEKTELDEYIIDRKNLVFLTIRLNEQSKKELTNGIETKEDAYDERKFLEESFLEEIEGLTEMQEEEEEEEDISDLDPGAAVHTDDDVSDLSEVEKQDLGISDNDDLDNNLYIDEEDDDDDDQDERK